MAVASNPLGPKEADNLRWQLGVPSTNACMPAKLLLKKRLQPPKAVTEQCEITTERFHGRPLVLLVVLAALLCFFLDVYSSSSLSVVFIISFLSFMSLSGC